MIDTIILACIGITLFLGICKLRIDLNTINENFIELAKDNNALLKQINAEMNFLSVELQEQIKKALRSSL